MWAIICDAISCASACFRRTFDTTARSAFDTTICTSTGCCCPNRQQRTRERRHRLTKAQPSNPEEHGDIARAVSPACRRAPRRSSVQRPASSVPYRPSPLPAVVLRAMRIHLLDTRVSRHACCTRTPRALSNTLVTLDHAGASMRHVRVTGAVRIRRAARGRRHQRDIQV